MDASMPRLILLLCCAALLASCETIKGVGRDVTRAGEALDDVFD
jgi:predicted small secreted protein